MKTCKIVIGILLIVFSGIVLLICLFSLMIGRITDTEIKYIIFSITGLIIGIVLTSSADKNNINQQEIEEYRIFKQQQMQQYYRYANAQGKPIDEYLMDERTKLITYYDRMTTDYKKKLADYADTLYRRFENEKYTQK